ncbi:MAG: GyrI-like domain-containing protein [Nitrolancea sp.]
MPRSRTTQPEIVDLPDQLMAVIYSRGDPNEQSDPLAALYGAVYTLKFVRKRTGGDFKVGPLRARWPDAHLLPKEEWLGVWALPIPDDVTSLPQKTPGFDVRIERWSYGAVAQILHTGSYLDEGNDVQRLHEFIDASGYDITGVHEEEYLTSPKAKTQKTIIRYPVTPKSGRV